MAGYIKLYRDIQDHWLWQEKPFSKAQAWIDLLMMANHIDKQIPFGNDLVLVERGCLITSEVKLAVRWGWSRTKARAFLDMLKSDNMIDKQSDNKKTYIKVLNYSVWQDSETVKNTASDTTEEQQKNSKKTAKKQQKNTNKNDKNDKNDKNNKNNIFIPPTLEEVTSYCKERNNSVDPQKWYDFYSAKGWMIGKNKMKDWKAAVRTWERRDSEKNTQDFAKKYDYDGGDTL